MLVYSKHTLITLTAYLSLLISWFYLRLFVLPYYIIWNLLFKAMEAFPPHTYDMPMFFLTGMVVVLQALHVYWYALFLKMGYIFLTSGETKDIQQVVGAEETQTQRETDKNK